MSSIRLAASLAALFVLLPAACRKSSPSRLEERPPVITPIVLRSMPHDTTAFTQGLLYRRGSLYESTGLYGRSSLRRLDAQTGSILKIIPLQAGIFAEGLALVESTLVQLTWREQRALTYRLRDLAPMGAFIYAGEGWGLAWTPVGFAMSNGSDSIYFRGAGFSIKRAMQITHAGKPLDDLNELEFAGGKIYANVWYSGFIFEIDPSSGRVTRAVDCASLIDLAQPLGQNDVLNGIAYNDSAGTFYITGKNWRRIFEVKLP